VDLDSYKAQLGYGTAVSRKVMSRPMSFFLEFGLLNGDVLDYGSGQDVHEFDRYDPFYANNPEIFKARYDVVTCNYVLNVIPLEHCRRQTVFTVNGLLKPEGYALFTVKMDGAEDSINTKGFQSGWSFNEWLQFLRTFCFPEPIERVGAFKIPKF
jgi:hypothetical protein